jgi:glycosyltransferase A (GT-A) superfamily protein (DUF2064 family)
MSRPTVILFLRAPRVGQGKSRLARDVGKVEAWRISRWLTARALRRIRDPRWKLVIRVTPDGALPGAEPQGGGDLGQRLRCAIRDHARGPVAVVGTDIPDLDAARIARAFVAARRHGAAIGPADDGGFWILALSARRARSVGFDGVRWSTADACADTVKTLAGKVAKLEQLTDIDDAASLRAWRGRRGPTLKPVAQGHARRRQG